MKKTADFISSLYSTAVNVQNFDRLIDLSEQTLSGRKTEESEFQNLRKECENHIREAEKLLDQIPLGLEEDSQKPVFFVSKYGKIENPNQIACELFGIAEGDALGSVLENNCWGDQELVSFGETAGEIGAIRLGRGAKDKPVIMLADRSQTNGRVRLVGMDAIWHGTAQKAVQAIYGLTMSEAEVLGLLMEGDSPGEVAAARGRSVETVRQQIKAITQKMQANGLQEAIHLARAVAVSCRSKQVGVPLSSAKCLVLPDGRTLQYREQGMPDGYPVIFLHGCLGGNRLSGRAEAALCAAGIRLVSPARPWHGQSCGHPLLLEDPGLYSEDIELLADRLGIEQFALLSYDTGCIFALTAAKRLAGRIDAIVCASAQPPMRGLADFASAPQQHRIFAVLARTSLPLLGYLSRLGDRKLKKEGRAQFAKTVFSGAEADMVACGDEEVLDLLWDGHHFHVEKGSESFINDCRFLASNWSSKLDTRFCPVHFVHGTEDASIHPDRVKAFSEALKADTHWVDGAGHILPFSHGEKLASILKNTVASSF